MSNNNSNKSNYSCPQANPKAIPQQAIINECEDIFIKVVVTTATIDIVRTSSTLNNVQSILWSQSEFFSALTSIQTKKSYISAPTHSTKL